MTSIYRYHNNVIILKTKDFWHTFFEFFWIYLKIKAFSKKSSLIAQVFLKLLTLKDLVTETHKKFYHCKLPPSEHVNGPQKLLKSAKKTILAHCFIILSKIKFEKVIFSQIKNLRWFFNKFTEDGKYSGDNRVNLPLPLQMHLSKSK